LYLARLEREEVFRRVIPRLGEVDLASPLSACARASSAALSGCPALGNSLRGSGDVAQFRASLDAALAAGELQLHPDRD
jgi:hypothetical protein